jgi:hypothetical protein
MPALSADQLAELLPERWQAARRAAAPASADA